MKLKSLLSILVLLISESIFISCSQSDFEIKATIVSDKLDYIDLLEFRIIDMSNKSVINPKVILTKKGELNIKLNKDQDRSSILLEVESWASPPWEKPYISTSLKPINIDNALSKIDIGIVYITDPISIITKKHIFNTSDDIFFKWEGFTFADFYSIAISKKNSDAEYKLYINTHNLKDPSFNYYESSKYCLVNGPIEYHEFNNRGPFNRMYSQIVPGEYKLNVQAYAIDDLHKNIELVGKTSTETELYFIVE